MQLVKTSMNYYVYARNYTSAPNEGFDGPWNKALNRTLPNTLLKDM